MKRSKQITTTSLGLILFPGAGLTTEQLCVQLDSEKSSFRFEFGFSAPSSKSNFADKVNIVKTLSLHYLIYGNQADIDQLMDGFETLGIPQLMQPILQSTAKPVLTSPQMLKLSGLQMGQINVRRRS